MGCSSSTAVRANPRLDLNPKPLPVALSEAHSLMQTTPVLLTQAAFPRLSDSDSITSQSTASQVSFDPNEEMQHPSAIAAFAAARYTRERTLLATQEPPSAACPRNDTAIDREWKVLQAQVPSDQSHVSSKGTPTPTAQHSLLKHAIAPRQVQLLRKQSIESRHSIASPAQRTQSAWSTVTFLSSGAIGLQDFYNSFNAGIVRPFIVDQDYMLIVDTRSKEDFDKGHVVSAVNRASVASLLSQYNLEDFSFIVLYDTNGKGQGTAEAMCAQLRMQEWDHVGVLNGGYNKVETRYPFLITDENPHYGFYPERRVSIPNYPSEVWPGLLYLGNKHHAADPNVVKGMRLTHIVNCSIEHPNTFEEDVSYLSIRLTDESDQDIKVHFRSLCAFLDRVRAEHGRCLVHCTMGVSRSSTCMIAYLMHSRGLTLKSASELVKDKRQGIRPNRGFLKQLAAWEQELLGCSVTSYDDLRF
eukprot:m.263 g.263  ORF g.263 m.263 type:complete len:471 (-) comp345_c0_seq1:46-1458(-)